ncbi:MAG TPA: alpha/beta fold hydrolase [Casimicrobiaceae bacterium]|nr:alpha/beta fold hydrolase [Casimicrobiaceae bacterium]
MTMPIAALQRFASLLLLSCCLCVLAGCGDRTSARRIKLSECRLSKVAQAVQCGRLEVPENRMHPNGRRLSIFVAVLPANTLSPAPDPLFLIAGGPGQAASSLGPFAMQLALVRRTRDIVLVDQRGTGRSSPLACPAFAPDEHVEFDTDPVPKATLCAKQLAQSGVDASQYTTSAWVEDLDAVRDALGYRRVNLWGGSYGTRVAQEYVRRHGDHVRGVVLDGVAPFSMRISFDVWRTRAQALDALLAACRASPACAKTHRDPAAALDELHVSFASGKDVTLRDPRTGTMRPMRIDFDAIYAALQPLTYSPEAASLIPELVSLARDGEYGPLLATALTVVGDLPEEFTPALFYSVTCAEDVPRITPEERTSGVADPRGRALARRSIEVCDHWPKGSYPADFATPVVSNVPVLLLSGGLDPVTPPPYAAEVAKGFPNSRQVVAAGFGHIVSPHACAPRLVAAFVDTATFDKLSADCIEFLARSTRPPLWPDRLAPLP